MTTTRGNLLTSDEHDRTPSPLNGSLPAELASIGGGRSQLSTWLTGRTVDDQASDIVLVFSELLTNAVDASPANTAVTFWAKETVGQITVTVINSRSDLSAVAPVPMPCPEAERGRGLALAEVYSDKLEILLDLEVIEVSATFVLPTQHPF